jgi:hypothetical protein
MLLVGLRAVRVRTGRQALLDRPGDDGRVEALLAAGDLHPD